MLGGYRELLLHPKEAAVLQLGGQPIHEGAARAGEGADLHQEPEEEKVFPEN